MQNMINKNKGMVAFFEGFKDFEDRMDGCLSDLSEKCKSMTRTYNKRLDSLDLISEKSAKKIVLLDRDVTKVLQEMASHKLQKRR